MGWLAGKCGWIGDQRWKVWISEGKQAVEKALVLGLLKNPQGDYNSFFTGLYHTIWGSSKGIGQFKKLWCKAVTVEYILSLRREEKDTLQEEMLGIYALLGFGLGFGWSRKKGKPWESLITIPVYMNVMSNSLCVTPKKNTHWKKTFSLSGPAITSKW